MSSVMLKDVADICDSMILCEDCPFVIADPRSVYQCIFNLPPVAWDGDAIDKLLQEYRGKEHVESVCRE